MEDDPNLTSLIKSANTNRIAEKVKRNHYLLSAVVDRKYDGTLLHLSAKYDTKNRTNITRWLLSNYEIDPNIQNNGESLPLYWALEQANIKENPNFEPFKLLLFHKNFELFLRSESRVSPYSFIRKFYYSHEHFPHIQHLLEEKIWKSKKVAIYLYTNLHRHSLL